MRRRPSDGNCTVFALEENLQSVVCRAEILSHLIIVNNIISNYNYNSSVMLAQSHWRGRRRRRLPLAKSNLIIQFSRSIVAQFLRC